MVSVGVSGPSGGLKTHPLSFQEPPPPPYRWVHHLPSDSLPCASFAWCSGRSTRPAADRSRLYPSPGACDSPGGTGCDTPGTPPAGFPW